VSEEHQPHAGTPSPPAGGSSKEYISAPGAPPAKAYTHVVKVGHTLYISGQMALDVERRLVGPGDVAAQTRQALDNVGRLLAAGGAGWADLVKLTIYLADIRDVDAVRAARAAHYERVGIRPPATTTVAVTGLAVPGALIEIEATAVAD
jgi:enamine deaminase RidA (YjgF/YER057c/UK114 family)